MDFHEGPGTQLHHKESIRYIERATCILSINEIVKKENEAMSVQMSNSMSK